MRIKPAWIDHSLKSCGVLLGGLLMAGWANVEAIASPVAQESQCDIETVGPTIACRASDPNRPVLSSNVLLSPTALQGRIELLTALFEATSTLPNEIHHVYVWTEMATQINQWAMSYGLGPLDDNHPLVLKLDQLDAAATDVSSARHQVELLVAIATARTTVGQDGNAVDDLAIATEAVNSLSASGQKALLLNAIASAYIGLDRPTEAAEHLASATVIAAQIEDQWWKPQILSSIAASYIALGDRVQAVDVLHRTIGVIHSMPSSPAKMLRWDDVIDLATQLDDERMTMGILQTVLEAQDDFAQTNAADPLVAIAAAAGELKDSYGGSRGASALLVSIVEMVGITDNPFSQLEVVEAIASAMEARSYPDEDHELLLMAAQSVDRIDDDWNRARALVAIATAYAQMGDSQQAVDHLSTALAIIGPAEGDRLPRELTGELGDELAGAEGAEGAEGFFDAQFARNLLIINQLETLQAIATAAGALQDPQSAATVLEATVDIATAVFTDAQEGLDLVVWTDVAKQYAQQGQEQRAIGLLEEAFPMAQQLLEQRIYSEGPFIVIQWIASAYIEMGQPEKAAAVLRDAIASTQRIQNERERFGALNGLVRLHGDLGAVELARDGLELAIVQTSFSEAYPGNAPILFRHIAEAYGRLGDRHAMDQALRQSLDVSQTRLTQARVTLNNTMEAATLYRQFDQADDAIHLLDAAHELVHAEFKGDPLAALDDNQRADYLFHLERLVVDYDAVGHASKAMDVMMEAIAVIDAMDEPLITSMSPQPPHSKRNSLDEWIELMGRLTDDETRLESLAAILPTVMSLAEDRDKGNSLTLMVQAAMMLNSES